MPIGSIAGGLIGQAGAQQGGQMAYNAAQQGATTNQNILNDQMKNNRVASSPYTGAGREALSQIGMLMGWGNLATEGGHDDWRFANVGGSNEALGDAQQKAQRLKMEQMAGLVPRPEFSSNLPLFDRLNVSDKFEADPGYNFRQAEGQKALEHGAAARGKLLSGEQFKALSDFNSGLASQEYGNWWNRYTGGTQFNNAAKQQEFANKFQAGQADYSNAYTANRNVLSDWMQLAGMGQGSVNAQSGVNSSLAGNVGNAFAQAGISGGQALGKGYSDGANALASGIGHGISNAATLGWMGFNPRSGIFSGGGGGSSIYDSGSGRTY